MKRIAIITPCILPVPATKGGAVEGLITRILDDNEIYGICQVDLYTIADDSGAYNRYRDTYTIEIDYDRFTKVTDKVLDKICRTFAVKGSRRLIDNTILNKFVDRLNEIGGAYEAVVIENMMSTAVKIVDYCEGKYGFPIFFHMHNDVDVYRSPEYIDYLVKHGVQFISVSEYIKGQINRYNPYAQVAILYNGVDFDKYDREVKESSSQTVFLYAGRVIPTKGVKELLSAFILLLNKLDPADREKIRLDIVGFSGIDREYENGIRREADNYSNIACIDQIPADKMSELYNKADVVVMPTVDEEPFGLVALETMAKGKTLITTNSGAIPEVVSHAALIVDKNVNFVENLSEAMLELYRDSDYRRELAEAAYKRSRNSIFDISIYYKCFIDIICKELQNGLISVIVPVYNVAPFLGKCVDSLLEQTYANTEILLIDDGSTDESGRMCDDYSAKDSRIKVIHKVNGGLSSARNAGIEAATGDYLFFCDSDDYLEADALEKLYQKLIGDNADIVACGVSEFWASDNQEESKRAFTSDAPGRWSGYESVIQMMRTNNLCTVAWNKLYRKALFDDVRFPEGKVHEDEATTYKLLYKAKIVSYFPTSLYNYRQRDESIMHNKDDKRDDDLISAIKDRVIFFDDLKEKELEEHSLISLLEFIKDIYRSADNNSRRKELALLYNKLLDEYPTPEVLGKKKKVALKMWKYIKY